MAYNRAPRNCSPTGNQTGPNVSPNTYKTTSDCNCTCKGTNWAPFLTCSSRKSVRTEDSPGPNSYFPQVPKRIIGGVSPSHTAPRFPDNYYTGFVLSPTEYDPFPVEEAFPETPPRLKGFMYHCNVPYTLLGYPPSIPNQWHFGYDISEDHKLVECCDPQHDTTLGPAFYHVNHGTFGTCYRGSYWSRYSKRKFIESSDTPGVGTYNLEPEPTQLEKYLTELRHERKKAACSLRYIDEIQNSAIKNDYPAPNKYNINKMKCFTSTKSIVPRKLIRPKKILSEVQTSPAPNQYNDPRTAFNYLVKPSCRKGYNAFLSNAPRFPETDPDSLKKPAPNQYNIKSFVEELALKISPYAVRKTAFDTSVPKKLYYLPPEYEYQAPRKPCKCSGTLPEPEPELPKPRPVHPFASKTERFKTADKGYDASCVSYDIREPYSYVKNPTSFRKVRKYNFLFTEKRFAKVTNFVVTEDKAYVPGPTYNYFIPNPGQSVTIGRAERFQTLGVGGPGPLDYEIKRDAVLQTFNVTLRDKTCLNPLQVQRLKLMRKMGKWSKKRSKGTAQRKVSCLKIHPVSVNLSVTKQISTEK